MFLKKLIAVGTISFLVIALLFIAFGDLCAQETRTVYVKAVADEEYIFLKGKTWQEEIRNEVEKASQEFERQFGIKFVLKKIGRWESEDVAVYFWGHLTPWISWMELAREVDLEDCDILVGFTAQFHGGHPVFGATVAGQTNITLIKDFLSFLRDKWRLGENTDSLVWGLIRKNGPVSEYQHRILVHEFGRAFGARDTEEGFSVMNQRHILKTTEFDPENKKRILENKWRDFKK